MSLIGLSATGFAAVTSKNTDTTTSSSATTGILLTAPSNAGGWIFGLEGAYIKPNADVVYAADYTLATLGSVTPLSATNLFIDPGYHWAGTVTVGYIFANTGDDLSLNYTYFNATAHDSASAVESNQYLWIHNPNGANQKYAKDSFTQTLNAVDLTFGKQLQLGNIGLHPFIGLRYADLDLSNSAKFYFLGTQNWRNVNHSDFDGIGPRLGLDGTINLSTHFSVVSTVGGSLLAGNLDASTTQYYYGALTSIISPKTKITNHATTVVPEVDAKLGLGYTHDYYENNVFYFQLGYEVVDYINGVNFDSTSQENVNSMNDKSDFVYHGPYAKVQVNLY